MGGTVADWLTAGKRRLRRAVARLAPVGSARRMAVNYVSLMARQGLVLPVSPRERNCPPYPDLFDRQALNAFLEPYGIHLAGRPISTPDAVLHWYDHYPLARKIFPLAATPCERGPFLTWLLHNRRTTGLTEDEILGFFFAMAERPDAGLSLLYHRHPEWQRAVPDALGPYGWDRLRDWIGRRYRVRGRWLDEAVRPDRPPLRGPGVNLLGHFCYPSGLQVAALNTVRALERVGWHVCCRDVPTGGDLPGRENYLGLHPFPVTISQLAPEPYGAESYELAGLARRPNTYRIGYWYWELEEAPRAWRRRARWLDELWAPTRFIADALRRTLELPVVPMLPGVEPPRDIAVPRSHFGLPEDRFLFLTMFDMASTFDRKNPLAAVEAFRRAFAPEAPVALVVKVTRGAQDPLALQTLRRQAEPGRIVLLEGLLVPDQVAAVHGCCDAYVSLHRSEGFGLTLAEAMALGKPTIATGYSGNLDFMDDSNSLLVRYRKVPIRADVHVYRKGCLWAEPCVEHAMELMRWVVANPLAARELGQRARRSVREKLSPEAAGRRMAERLQSLAPGG